MHVVRERRPSTYDPKLLLETIKNVIQNESKQSYASLIYGMPLKIRDKYIYIYILRIKKN